jgi:hypothetical protein
VRLLRNQAFAESNGLFCSHVKQNRTRHRLLFATSSTRERGAVGAQFASEHDAVPSNQSVQDAHPPQQVDDLAGASIHCCHAHVLPAAQQ